MSSAFGSSTEASCCVARKIFRSPERASSRARTLDSRPTTNGVIIWGKMTMSRIGIIGSLRTSPLRAQSLARFLQQSRQRQAVFLHHLCRYGKIFDLLVSRNEVHQVQHQLFENHPQSARANLSLQRLPRDLPSGLLGEGYLHAFKLEELC